MKTSQPRRRPTSADGLTLAESIFAIGILALALFALISVCSMALRFQRQSLNNLNAARITDMVLGRTVASVLTDTPAGEEAAFWGATFPYPGSPFRNGVEKVGNQEFSWFIYTTDMSGVTTLPDNRLRRVDAYVVWSDKELGAQISSATRLVNEGEEP